MYAEKIRKALKSLPTEIEDEFPLEMPLLDDFRKAHVRGSDSLSHLEVLFIQHHLGPFLLRLNSLFDEGLKPEKTWLVDIPYSTNERVRQEIPKRFGVPHFQIAPPFRDPIAPYAMLQLQRVKHIVYHLANRLSQSPLLVVDDGAYFIRALKDIDTLEPGFARAFKGQTVIVEQTTRGHRYLDEEGCKNFVERVVVAPVVSIARCNTKTEVEAPFIGAAASRAAVKTFKSEGIDINSLGQIAIIGFGPVGKAVFQALRVFNHQYPIRVVDTDIGKHTKIADFGGIPLESLPGKGNFDLVVGCTGYSSFDLSDWKCLSENAMLASCSSAAVEFNRKKFVDLAELYPDDQIVLIEKEKTRQKGIHATVKIQNLDTNQQVSFLNASFPINFDGRMECLPVRYIQATHTLLYAAMYQVLETSKPGMTGIDPKVDAEISENAMKYI
jgi:hypothetical protein